MRQYVAYSNLSKGCFLHIRMNKTFNKIFERIYKVLNYIPILLLIYEAYSIEIHLNRMKKLVPSENFLFLTADKI